MRPYLEDWRGMYRGRARLVVKPASTEEVAGVVAIRHHAGIPVVPPGGHTSPFGASTHAADGGANVPSLVPMHPGPHPHPSNHTTHPHAGLLPAPLLTTVTVAH